MIWIVLIWGTAGSTPDIAEEIRCLLLQNYQVNVNMTRESDKYVKLSERARMANDWGAEYFLSIHINAGGGTGFESYVHESRRKQTVKRQETIHPVIADALAVRDRGQKTANFAVLRETTIPALLTENLFIDHREDAEKLSDSRFLQQIAQAHVTGLQKAFQLERKTEAEADKSPASAQQTLYRVLIDQKQVGAFNESGNIIRQVEQHLGKAKDILVQKV